MMHRPRIYKYKGVWCVDYRNAGVHNSFLAAAFTWRLNRQQGV